LGSPGFELSGNALNFPDPGRDQDQAPGHKRRLFPGNPHEDHPAGQYRSDPIAAFAAPGGHYHAPVLPDYYWWQWCWRWPGTDDLQCLFARDLAIMVSGW
jgi:hypothetical protein